MRYVAKIHVLDVLDQVVVSGYIYDADVMSSPEHEPTEFTYSTAGTGISEPLPWLLNSLYRCLVAEQRPAPGEQNGAPRGGSPYTVSGTGDTAKNLMG